MGLATPLDHQKPIISAVMKSDANRMQVIMACRTGKTYVGAFVAKKLGEGVFLLLVPSLALVRQAIDDWRDVFGHRLPILCVCSDKTTGKASAAKYDELEIDHASLDVPVTSDVNEIRRFMRGAGKRLIVGTYHSSFLIADAQVGRGMPKLALAIADEAHRMAGTDSDYKTILDSKKIRVKKLLFMTATPRIYAAAVQERSAAPLFSMDDEKVFGPIVAELSFGRARELGLIADWKIVVFAVTRDDLHAKLNAEKKDRDQSLFDTAAQVGLAKVIWDFGSKKVLTFHNRVARARGFAATFVETWKSTPANGHARVLGRMTAEAVAASEGNAEVRRKLASFEADTDTIRVLSNCRCLSEGVTVPDMDCVAILDPKQSTVDIVQSISRAIGLRKNGKLKTAVIAIPVFVRDGEDEPGKENIDATIMFNALAAMASIDGRVREFCDKIRSAARMGSAEKVSIPEWVFLDGISSDLREAVILKVLSDCGRGDVDAAKQQLLLMAREGRDRPVAGSRLGKQLNGFTCPTGPQYDHDLFEILKEHAPSWFRRTLKAERQERLIQMARRGDARPKEGELAGALKRYTTKQCYDETFDRLIREIAPNWFDNERLRCRRDEILGLARNGGSRPSLRSPLGVYLNGCVSKPATAQAAAFGKMIRTLRPEWFRKDRVKAYRDAITALAKSGSARPRNSKFRSLLHRDKRLRQRIMKIAPSWFRSDCDCTLEEIVRLVDSHFRKHGAMPVAGAGPSGIPGLSWCAIDKRGRDGRRGLARGETLFYIRTKFFTVGGKLLPHWRSLLPSAGRKAA